MTRAPDYLVVTPVKDEARHVAETVRSMIAQQHRPLRWVIVDDGSTDDTPAILSRETAGHDWITVLHTGNRERRLGSAEVIAFDHGLASVPAALPWQYVVKLDGDLRLPPDYFARLLARMAADTAWGIASGVYRERHDGAWRTIAMPAYHASGASKVVSRACWQRIGGFATRKGWDTVDEIKAGLAGWRTGHFPDLVFDHLKPEGAAMGTLATHRFHGEIYHATGGGFGFLLVKAAHRALTARPRLAGGLAMLAGYLGAVLARRPRLVDRAEARWYRALLRRRLAAPLLRRLRLAA